MPEDVQAALERFQFFVEQFGLDGLIDASTGFTASDAHLLIGELELAAFNRRREGRHEDDA